jgi:hypothetical protein
MDENVIVPDDPVPVAEAIDSNDVGIYAALPARKSSYFVRFLKLEPELNLVTATVAP